MQKKKKTSTFVTFKASSGNSDIVVYYDMESDAIIPGSEVHDAATQTQRDERRKTKDGKVVNKIPPSGDRIRFSTTNAAFDEYDFIFAVDTNTRSILGRIVSVSTIVIGHAQRNSDSSYSVASSSPFSIEISDAKFNPEKVGWVLAIGELTARGIVTNQERIGMIVDSSLGDHNEINLRSQPIIEGLYLPDRYMLLYASSDTGDSIPNKLIRAADKHSSDILDSFARKEIDINRKVTNGALHLGMRVLRY